MSDFLTISETALRCKAENIRLSENAIRRLVRNGSIPACFIGKRAMIFWPNILRFIKNGNSGSVLKGGDVV